MSTLILRPNGAGDYTNITHQYPDSGEHWDKVDEVTADDGGYIYETSLSELRDVYSLEDATAAGTIISVAVYFRCQAIPDVGYTGRARPLLRLGTNETLGTEIVLTSYATYNELLARPGGGAWSWADINNLQAGIGLWHTREGNSADCSHFYSVVDYFTPLVIII